MINISIASNALLVHNADMLNAEDIKTWLKEIGKDRAWLAEKTLVSKRTVDNWLSAGKPIVPQKMELIERLMNGDEEIEFELPPDFEKQLRSLADEMHKKLEDMVSYILQVTARDYYKNAAKEELVRRQFVPVETAVESPDYKAQIIGNTAAGKPADGATILQDILIGRPLEKDEYVLHVNGKSMEPKIPDGSLVVVREYKDYLFPKLGTLVVYNEGNDYTLKKLGRRKNPETGKQEYVLKSINSAFKDVEPIEEGKIFAVYVETLKDWRKG